MPPRQVQVLLPYDDETKKKAKGIIKALKGLPVVYGLAVFEGKGCVLLMFRTTARSSGKLLHILHHMGVGVGGYGFIDIVLLQSTTPELQPQRKPLYRRFKISDRVSIEEITGVVASGNHLTFNFIAFMLCAAVIASVGLATTSAATIIAAMLISPLMGPILAMTFGTITGNWRMTVKAIINESVGFLVVFAVGACWGLSTAWFPALWDGDEQLGRGSAWASVAGVGIAIPSGVALAIGTCNGEVGSLIGVAISASILPPIANGAMYLTRGVLQLSGLVEGDGADSCEAGGFSIMLFAVNVICIYVTGLATFGLKGVRPIKRLGKKEREPELASGIEDEYEMSMDTLSESESVEYFDPRVPPPQNPPSEEKKRSHHQRSSSCPHSPTSFFEWAHHPLHHLHESHTHQQDDPLEKTLLDAEPKDMSGDGYDDNISYDSSSSSTSIGSSTQTNDTDYPQKGERRKSYAHAAREPSNPNLRRTRSSHEL